jgi:hypothetical protein
MAASTSRMVREAGGLIHEQHAGSVLDSEKPRGGPPVFAPYEPGVVSLQRCYQYGREMQPPTLHFIIAHLQEFLASQ